MNKAHQANKEEQNMFASLLLQVQPVGVLFPIQYHQHIYVVGGAIRNAVLGIPPKDIDLLFDSVSAGITLQELMSFVTLSNPRLSVAVNQYGVAILTLEDGYVVEIAMARKESYHQEGYKPETVVPATVEEDVYRREFTCNTLLLSLADPTSLIDLVGGLEDVKGRTLCCPCDPDITFTDDPTRMIRAIKFMVKYGFSLGEKERISILKNADALRKMPPNAVSKILMDDVLYSAQGQRLLVELGLLFSFHWFLRVDAQFKTTIYNWAGLRGINFCNEMDGALETSIVEDSISFLSEEQKEMFRRNWEEVIDRDTWLAVLKQPGKAWQDKGFIPSLTQDKKQISAVAAQATIIARDILLRNPYIEPATLRNEIRNSLSC